MRTYLIDFDAKYQVANVGGKLSHTGSHLAHLLFEKGAIKHSEQALVLSQVGGGRNRYQEICMHLRNIMRDHQHGLSTLTPNTQ